MSWVKKTMGVTVAAILVVAGLLVACAETHRGKITIGGGLNISMLAIIAQERGFFHAEGVDVEFRPLQNGKVSFDAVVAGQVDVGIITDANAAVLGYSGLGDVRILGSIMKKTDDALIARRDAGIQRPIDLQGKLIAYVPAGTSEVFLASFMQANGIDSASTRTTPMAAQAMQAALTHGNVDAISIWQPFRLNILSALGDRGIEFSNNGIYWSQILLIARQRTISGSADEIKKIFKALIASSRYINSHRAESVTLLAKAIGVDSYALERSWDEYKFDVMIDRGLSGHLEDVARAIATFEPAFRNARPPDFKDWVDQNLLSALE